MQLTAHCKFQCKKNIELQTAAVCVCEKEGEKVNMMESMIVCVCVRQVLCY